MIQTLLDRLDRSIVLVGLMGAGKSTIGRRLAKRLELDFVDSDDAIAEAAGLSAAEVFERFGEADFRDGERRLVARLVEGPPKVIATGGGAYVDPQTRVLLNRRCHTIWLDAPIHVLVERTGRRDTRPLLRGTDREARLRELLEQRRPLYAEAHLHVRSSEAAHVRIVDAILRSLDEHLG